MHAPTSLGCVIQSCSKSRRDDHPLSWPSIVLKKGGIFTWFWIHFVGWFPAPELPLTLRHLSSWQAAAGLPATGRPSKDWWILLAGHASCSEAMTWVSLVWFSLWLFCRTTKKGVPQKEHVGRASAFSDQTVAEPLAWEKHAFRNGHLPVL